MLDRPHSRATPSKSQLRRSESAVDRNAALKSVSVAHGISAFKSDCLMHHSGSDGSRNDWPDQQNSSNGFSSRLSSGRPSRWGQACGSASVSDRSWDLKEQKFSLR